MTGLEPEFGFLQRLVLERAAIVLTDDKEYLLRARLNPVARELGFASAEDLLQKVRDSGDRQLEDRVVEAMTTNETLWFRDVHPFNALRSTVVPRLLERRASTRKLSVWSAASSSGQELYSVAMMLVDSVPDLAGWSLDLFGTDLSSEMVDRARRGRYTTLEINRGLPASMLIRHFSKEESGYRVSDAIRRMCSFRTMNLADPTWTGMATYDVILLRNVLIYFDLETRRRILENAAKLLAPDGCLFIGSSETMMGVTGVYEQESADGATFYRIKGAA